MNKILVVDDEKNIRDCLSKVLSFMGFEVAAASSGNEGLNLFNSRSMSSRIRSRRTLRRGF